MKNSQHRVRKHRALQTARKEEINYVNKILSNLEDNMSSSERNRNEISSSVIATLENNQRSYSFLHENTIIHNTQQIHSEILDTHSEILESVCTNSRTSSVELQNSVIDELRCWAIECNIQHNHLDKLLAILRKKLITALPQLSITFLRTFEADYKIVDMEDNDRIHPDGQFVYFGIGTQLQEHINSESYQNDIIRLLINIDGMPVSVSGSTSFWPILCKIYYRLDVYRPFIVCIYYGKSKKKIS